MAEIDFDSVLRNHGFIKMKPIPVEVEVMSLTSTKDRVFVSSHEAELLAAGPTLEDAMFYDKAAWRRARRFVISRDPICDLGIVCEGKALSTDVDHIIRAELYIASVAWGSSVA